MIQVDVCIDLRDSLGHPAVRAGVGLAYRGEVVFNNDHSIIELTPVTHLIKLRLLVNVVRASSHRRLSLSLPSAAAEVSYSGI